MVDLDSNPTKLIEIVEIGKQLLMTRGALTTFSIANDVAKYFAIIPAAFATTYPALNAAQHHAPGHARQRHPARRHLQRAHHRRADPPRAAGHQRTAPSARPGSSATTCSSTASAGSSCRSSASSSSTSSWSSCTWPERRVSCSQATSRCRRLPRSPSRSLTGGRLPAPDHRHRAGGIPAPGQRQPDCPRRQGGRLAAHRPAVRRPEVLLGAPVRRRPTRTAKPLALQRRPLRPGRTSAPRTPRSWTR